MWDWLEDHRYYTPCLWGLTIGLFLIPASVWVLYPSAGWFVSLLGLHGLLGVWAIHLAPHWERNVDFPPDQDRPEGTDAIVSRVRLGAFGAVTTAALLAVFAASFDRNITSWQSVSLLSGTVLLGIPAAVLSTRVTMWLLAGWALFSEMPLNAATIWIAAVRTGAEQDAAFQKLYDLENRFFVAISGYGTSFTFRSDSDWLRDDLPKIGNLP